MKRVFLGVSCLLLLLPLASLAADDDPPYGQITIYKDGGYSGSASNMSATEYPNLVNIGWNDMISSIKLGKGIIKVVVHQDIKYKGSSKHIRGDTDFSGTSWNDKISSFTIYKKPDPPPSNTVRFYWDKEYSGKTLDATADDPTLVDNDWNDKITSIMVGSSCEVKVFQDINYAGASKVISSDTDFTGTSWNDKVSSFRVIQK